MKKEKSDVLSKSFGLSNKQKGMNSIKITIWNNLIFIKIFLQSIRDSKILSKINLSICKSFTQNSIN